MKKLLPFLFLLAVFALYAQTLGFGLLRFDDPDYTIACAFVKDGLSWANLCEAFSNLRHGGIWMPLTYLSYMCDITLLGGSPAAFHLTNVVLHARNAVLLGLLLARLCHCDEKGEVRLLALAAVLVWAVHPQRVEAVAWVAARKELLWSAFALLGLLAWQRDRRAAAMVCMVCACLSKPTAMVFPALAFALDRLGTAEVGRPHESSVSWMCRLRPYLPLLALSVATGVIAVYSQTHPEGMATKELFEASLLHRLVNAVNAVGLYLAQALVPVGIHFDYRGVADLLPLGWYVGLPVVCGVGACGVWAGRARSPVPTGTGWAWCAFWMLATLGPTLGVFGSFGEHARADRFWYVASMAIPLAIVVLVSRSRLKVLCKPLTLALLALAVGYGAVAWFRIGEYRNDRTVFERTLRCDPAHGRALAHVGEAKCAAGELDAGIAMLRESRRVRPRFDTDAKLAYALMRRGRAEDLRAIRSVCVAAAEHPERDVKGQALEALGTAELAAGEWANAARHLARSVTAPRRFYSALDAQLKLAFALHNCGRRAEAEKLFELVYKSGRTDLAARAEQALTATADDPNAVLFW